MKCYKKTKTYTALFFSFCFLLFSCSCSPCANASQSGGLKVLEAGTGGMVMEFSSPQLRIEEQEESGIVYQFLTMSGTGLTQDEGKPQLPVQGFLMAIPASAELILEVLEQEVDILESLLIHPAPRRVMVTGNATSFIRGEFTIDRACYAQNQWIPEKPFLVDPAGYLRHRKIARLSIAPVQYNPALRKVRLYRRVKLKITFKDAPQIRSREISQSQGWIPENRHFCGFEQVMENTLINYPLVREYPDVFIIPPLAERKERSRKRISDSRLSPLKISLEQEGLYRVSGADLQRAGWDLNLVIPQKLAMYCQGREVPVSISGIEDGLFDPGDRITFWAAAMNSPFTRKNIYWLEQKEAGAGIRIKEQDENSPPSEPAADHFIDHLHREENHVYWQILPGPLEKDRWFWKQITAPAAEDFLFSLPRLSSADGERATLGLLFQGKTDIAATKPDHHVIITLNGSVIDDFSWDGQTEFRRRITVSSTLLQEGSNTLTIKAPGDTGAAIDTILVNWIELDYPRPFIAHNHQLLFTAQGGQGAGRCNFDVQGFMEKEISVFNVTDPENVLKIRPASIETEGGSTYRIKFSDEFSGSRRYAALSTQAEKVPLSLESPAARPGEEDDLRSSDNGADYLIITHPDFRDSILPLADYRKAQGLRVKIVDIHDIYDEFSSGIFDPRAVQDFVRYSYQNWTPPAPLYVLLVGDANMDYLDNYETGRGNYIPTHVYFTADLGETPNDNWFVCVDGDDILPDMFLGRIPVRTPVEVQSVVEKIISYEQQGDQPWHRKALFVADKENPEFKSMADGLAQDFIPWSLDIQKVYAASYATNEAAAEEVRRKISGGQLITVYCGHGNVDKWGSALFQSGDVQKLENIGQPGFFILLTCLNGFFPHPKLDCCLAEELLRAENKGALACWAPVSVSYPTEQKNLAGELFDQIFQQGNNILGVCTTAARINAYARHRISGDMAQNFLLFGDPATRLQGKYGVSRGAQITIKPGSNLLGLPGGLTLPWRAGDFLEYLSRQSVTIRKTCGYNPAKGEWQTGVWDGESFTGANFEILPEQGYLLYAGGDSDRAVSLPCTAFYPQYTLRAGYNLLNFPAPLSNYTSYDLLQEIGAGYAFSVTGYNKRNGKWQGCYSFFTRTAGDDYQIESSQGYSIGMGEARSNWRPGPWAEKINDSTR
ncbi:MAG: C25 family cysteine peptidase [bacterium]